MSCATGSDEVAGAALLTVTSGCLVAERCLDSRTDAVLSQAAYRVNIPLLVHPTPHHRGPALPRPVTG